MRRLLLTTALIALALTATAQAEDAPPTAKPEPKTASHGLPKAWQGAWKGACRTASLRGKATTFPMELRVAPIPNKAAWTWTIVYGEGAKRQVRPYELLAVPGSKGHFRIDEKNSIVIDAYLLGDTLYSRFEVMGNVIDARYTLRGAALDVSLVTTKAKAVSTTGGKGRVPAVKAFPVIAAQSGTLSRSD